MRECPVPPAPSGRVAAHSDGTLMSKEGTCHGVGDGAIHVRSGPERAQSRVTVSLSFPLLHRRGKASGTQPWVRLSLDRPLPMAGLGFPFCTMRGPEWQDQGPQPHSAPPSGLPAPQSGHSRPSPAFRRWAPQGLPAALSTGQGRWRQLTAGCLICSLLRPPCPRLRPSRHFPSPLRPSSDVQGGPGSAPWAWPQCPIS